MAADDHAIIVGISRYPTLGFGNTPLNLHGPDGDLKGVAAWLLDTNGGDVPKENIQTVCCPQQGTGSAEPAAVTVEKALVRLYEIAQNNIRAGDGRPRVGRRLYMYMAGHGFSASPEKACLFTAEATLGWGQNVHATGWLTWLRDSGLFSELVLWMDCCMDGMGTLLPGDTRLAPMTNGEPAGPSFVAFAAPRPLLAVESQDGSATGRWHGVFTSVLLEGLYGAAADTNGRVTGRSLGDWLRSALASQMAPSDVANDRVAKEPMIVRDDDTLVFARGVPPKTYVVRLQFPAEAVGGTGRLWSSIPPAVVQTFQIRADPQVLHLRPGLYLVEASGAGLRQGYVVTGPATWTVTEKGAAVTPGTSSSMFRLHVVTPPEGAHRISVRDCRLASADTALGELDVRLPFGLYKVRVSTGRSLQERVILLDADQPPFDDALIAQLSVAAAPIPGTAAASGPQAVVAQTVRAEGCRNAVSGQAVLTVLARTYGEATGASLTTMPWKEGIRVLDSDGGIVMEVAGVDFQHAGDDYCAACAKAVPPGAYFLRRTVEGQEVEQVLIAVAGWSLDVSLLYTPPSDSSAVRDRPRLSLLMRGLEDLEPDPVCDARTETARLALLDERDVLDGPLGRMLLDDFRDPMTGLIVAHLLLLARERGRHDPKALTRVVKRLTDMVGADHPDVVAIASATSPLPHDVALRSPPMLERSWTLLARADAPDLISTLIWSRVEARVSLPLYLVWATSEAVHDSVRRNIRKALVSIVDSDTVNSIMGAALPALTDTPIYAYAASMFNSALFQFGLPKASVVAVLDGIAPTVGNFLTEAVWSHVTSYLPDALAGLAERARQLGLPVAAVKELVYDLVTGTDADDQSDDRADPNPPPHQQI